MKSKRLNRKESKKLVWLTWWLIVLSGVIVYFFSDPLRWQAIVAGPVALCAMIKFWVKSDRIQARLYSVVPTVFLPTAFLSGVAALIFALVGERIMNSWTIALGIVCVLCLMAVYPESRYADYDWDSSSKRENPSHYMRRIILNIKFNTILHMLF